MKSLPKMLALAAVAALCIVAPAAATVDTSPPATQPSTGSSSYMTYTVRAGGSVHLFGDTGPLGTFEIVPVSATRARITFVNKRAGIDFHSLGLVSFAAIPSAVRMSGTGVVNGKMVQFVAVAIRNVANHYADRFAITWNHKARMGGPLTKGSVEIIATKV